MSLSNVHKIKCLSVSYLVLILVVNALADISLDYYFGSEGPLRSSSIILLEDCGTVADRYRCYQRCAKYHACFTRRCYCVKVKVSSEEDEEIPEEISQEEHSESVETQEDLPLSVEENVGAETFYDYEEDEEDEQKPLSNQEAKDEIKEESVEKPVLRHHIAHFCPDLNVARDCIRKCMGLGLPAFCGKDHNCYCSHTYANVVDPPEGNPEGIRVAFRDLYQKYFGPEDADVPKNVDQ